MSERTLKDYIDVFKRCKAMESVISEESRFDTEYKNYLKAREDLVANLVGFIMEKSENDFYKASRMITEVEKEGVLTPQEHITIMLYVSDNIPD